LPFLFTFHEPWEPDEEEETQPNSIWWFGLAFAGLLLGFIIYLVLVPLGGAAKLARTAAATGSPIPVSDVALTTPTVQTPPTACTPAEQPNSSLAQFITAIDQGDFETAWQLTHPRHRQQAYDGTLDQFIDNWQLWGRLSLGQTTYSLPQEGQAIALAQLTYGTNPSQQVDVRLAFEYSPADCRWLITQINPLRPVDSNS
jgi:hypothetical protein